MRSERRGRCCSQHLFSEHFPFSLRSLRAHTQNRPSCSGSQSYVRSGSTLDFYDSDFWRIKIASDKYLSPPSVKTVFFFLNICCGWWWRYYSQTDHCCLSHNTEYCSGHQRHFHLFFWRQNQVFLNECCGPFLWLLWWPEPVLSRTMMFSWP